MKAPQIIYVALSIIGLMLSAYEHGKPRKPGNVWHAVIATVIVWSLLIWGGFFN